MLTAARVVAVLAALFWGVLFFGIIDLLVVPIQDEQFFRHYVLETGWGLLFTALVMLPLLLWAARPQWGALPVQVLAVAVAVVLMGVVTGAPRQVLLGAALAASVALPVWQARSRSTRVRWSLDGVDRALLVLVAVSVVGGVTYAVLMVGAIRAGKVDEVTNGLEHLPMQAALGLGAAASVLVAVLAGGSDVPGWRASLVPACLCAGWFGVVCLLYPDHLGSVGTVGAVLVIVWGLAVAAAGWRTRRASAPAAG